MTDDVAVLCSCGCGTEIPARRYQRPSAERRFINGHQARKVNGERVAGTRRYTPTPDEIPDGWCRCGCGGRTEIAKHTSRATGRFMGHPAPFIRGHNSPRNGDKHPRWKGGRTIDGHGYVRVKAPEHPSGDRNGYVKEHRLVMEAVLGRSLLAGESVHHKNGIRSDNTPDNLELWTTSQPYGQRASDKVAWAVELLKLYAPQLLATSEQRRPRE
jgi:hypothetical protein